MILKSVTLTEIRSYREETSIPIPTGVTLFEGDMASGKSTILYSIEFALFGLGSFKGTFLLNNRAKRGDVTLVFEVDGKEYEVHRALQRKGKTIQQVDCYIKGPEGKVPLATTELKERILQLLRFNEPSNPRAQSVIYRYAVFTPQEEMKTVIEKDPDERLQTLRRAFGIEQYKTAIQNSSVVASRIKERMDLLQGASIDLEEVRRKQAEEDADRSLLVASLDPLGEKERELKKERDKEKESLTELQEAREKIKITEGTVPLLENDLKTKVKQRNEAKEEAERLASRIAKELEPRATALGQIRKPTEQSKQSIKKEVQECRAKKVEAESLRSKLEERIGNFDSILEKKTCPVCERKVDPKDFSSKSNHLKKEKDSLDKAITAYEGAIAQLEELQDQLGVYETAQTTLQNLTPQLDELNAKVDGDNKIVRDLTPLIIKLVKQIHAAKDEVEPLQALQQKITAQEAKVIVAEENLTEAGKEIVKVNERIRGLKESLVTRGKEIKSKEEQRKKRDSLAEDRIWLTQYMSPTIENIERHVMSSLNQSFNLQFQKWFQILMDNAADLQVRVDEEFSPIIEREEYEQEYQALSGGERTSVAFAYRLALNMTVQEVATNGQENLLILDEPTDGFSKEQLSRVREVLRELNAPQVILVSHETELEGFADHIVKVENSNGTSTVHLQSE